MSDDESPEVKATRQLHDIAMATGMAHQAVMGIAGIFKRLNDAEAERDALLAEVHEWLEGVYGDGTNWRDLRKLNRILQSHGAKEVTTDD